MFFTEVYRTPFLALQILYSVTFFNVTLSFSPDYFKDLIRQKFFLMRSSVIFWVLCKVSASPGHSNKYSTASTEELVLLPEVFAKMSVCSIF